MKIDNIKDNTLYWYVYKTDDLNNVELLLVKASIILNELSFTLMVEDDETNKLFEVIDIEINQEDEENPMLFEYDDKLQAELKWFEEFYKNFENLTSVPIERFLELYKYVQNERPDIIFKVM